MTDLHPPHRRNLLKGVAVVAGAMAVPMMARAQTAPASLSNVAVQDAIREYAKKSRGSVSAWDFMTAAQIEEAQAYTFATNMTAVLQAAMDAAWAANTDLFIPAGGYKVTGLTLPGTDGNGGTKDWRNRAFKMYGQGSGELFARAKTAGTIIYSVTDAPILADILGLAVSSNGMNEISYIRFEGSSTTPVILLQSFYGQSSIHHCNIYQASTGDGLKITYAATVWVHDCWALNKDWNTYKLGARRTGVGFNFPLIKDSGLVTFTKCTSRGWSTGYQIGGGAGVPYSPTVEKCECSVTHNGIIVNGTVKAVIDSNYMEGGDDGIGVLDNGTNSVISNNLIFSGYAVGIDASSTTKNGSLITGNTIGIAARANSIGIKIDVTASAGGKAALGNTISYALGTVGVVGIALTGASAKINLVGNNFDPAVAWTGAGSSKITDTTLNSFGVTTAMNGDREFPHLSQGMVSLGMQQAAFTQADVVANVLTLQGGSYFVCSATGAASVQRISAGNEKGRLVVFRTTTGSMTFQNSAYIKTAAGANFTGPGTITFLIDRTSGFNYAYEVARTTF